MNNGHAMEIDSKPPAVPSAPNSDAKFPVPTGAAENLGFSANSQPPLPELSWDKDLHGAIPNWCDWYPFLHELILLPENFDKKRVAQKGNRSQRVTLHMLKIVNQTYTNFFTGDVSRRFKLLHDFGILTELEAKEQHKLSLFDFEGRILKILGQSPAILQQHQQQQVSSPMQSLTAQTLASSSASVTVPAITLPSVSTQAEPMQMTSSNNNSTSDSSSSSTSNSSNATPTRPPSNRPGTLMTRIKMHVSSNALNAGEEEDADDEKKDGTYEQAEKKSKLNNGKAEHHHAATRSTSKKAVVHWSFAEMNPVVNCIKAKINHFGQAKFAASTMTLNQVAIDASKIMNLLCNGHDAKDFGAATNLVKDLDDDVKEMWRKHSRNSNTLLPKLRLLRHAQQWQAGHLEQPSEKHRKLYERALTDYAAIDWAIVKRMLQCLDTPYDSEKTDYESIVIEPLDAREHSAERIRDANIQKESAILGYTEQLEGSLSSFDVAVQDFSKLLAQPEVPLTEAYPTMDKLLESLPVSDKTLLDKYKLACKTGAVEQLDLRYLEASDLINLGFLPGHASKLKRKISSFKDE